MFLGDNESTVTLFCDVDNLTVPTCMVAICIRRCTTINGYTAVSAAPPAMAPNSSMYVADR